MNQRTWLYQAPSQDKYKAQVESLSRSLVLRFALYLLKKQVKARFPGIQTDQILIIIASAVLRRVSSSDASWVVAYDTRPRSMDELEKTLRRVRASGLEYYPTEDWLL